MYSAYSILHSNLTLLAPSLWMSLLPSAFVPLAGWVFFITFFSPYFPVLACGYLSHHSVLSFPKQNSRLGSICGETTQLEGREPIITLGRTSHGFPEGIRKKELWWLETCRKRVRIYDTTLLWGPTQLGGSPWSPGKRARNQKMRRIQCIICCMIKWYEIYLPRGLANIYSLSHSQSPLPLHLCTPPSPSWSPSSVYLHTPAIAQSSANLSGGGGETRIFLPHRLYLSSTAAS